MNKPFQISKREIKEEILRCGRDPIYFLKTYAKIVHPKRGEIPFATFDFQDDLLKKFRDYRFNVILKARQLGISTIVAGYAAWLMLFHKHKEVIVLATKQLKAANLLKKTKMILDRLPEWLKIAKVKTNNKTQIELTNGSLMQAESTATDAARSDALALLIMDEAAHILNASEIWVSASPALSTGGSAIILSTPKGVGSFFHQLCVDAEANLNEFVLTKLMWWVHPERDQEWFDKETRNMSERDSAQELLCSFNSSGDTVIHPDDITRIESEVLEPKYKTGMDRNYWIWGEYDSKKTYLITVDVARGDGEDFSSIVVTNLQDVEVVAEYKGKLSRDIFVGFLNTVCDEYGNPMLVIENNNIGITVAEDMLELGYPHLYFSKKGTHEYVDTIQAIGDSSAIPGFTTSPKTRPLVIAKLEEYIRNKVLRTYSSRFLNELKTFIWNNGKPEAQKHYNDDLIMATAIACWVRDTALIKGEREAKFKREMLSAIQITSKKMNTLIPGMHDFHKTGRILEERIKQRKCYTDEPWIFVG